MKEQKERQCTNCTACCEGWLGGEAHGKKFQSGRPCHFKCEGGCSIYSTRPHVCRNFDCEWKVNNELPEWMKPNLSGVMVAKKGWGPRPQRPYYEVLELGKKIDSVVLNWFFTWHSEAGVCIRVMVDGGWFYYGTEEFKRYFN